MQSVCLLMPHPFAARVVKWRARAAADPALGAIYDPPFVHCTLQLAEAYDWEGLAVALGGMAKHWESFTVTPVGVLGFTGAEAGIAVAPEKSPGFVAFHAAVWEAATPYAQGRVNPFYQPDRWVPHVTVKRCGPHSASFGAVMAMLATESLAEPLTLDTIAVQHDPGQNSLTHYLRLRFPLGGAAALLPAGAAAAPAPNATIRALQEARTADGAPVWQVTIEPDGSPPVDVTWDAPTLVRLSAAAAASPVHFPGGRCILDGDRVQGTILPETPYPVA
jgi:2'-5' RNA ligase